MFNPYEPLQMRRLTRAVKKSFDALEPHRTARSDLVKEFIGAGYGDQSPGQVMPVNMLVQMVDIYLMYLAGASPQVLLPTARKDILPFVADLEAIVNQELQEMKFDKTLRRWVLESLFSIGVLKCGMVDADYIEIIPGQPQPSQDYFADVVDFDDFVYDTNANSWDRITFIGDRYRVDMDALMENENFEEAGKVSLREHADSEVDGPTDRVGDFSKEEITTFSEEGELRKTAWVWDVALPEEGLVITYADAAADSVMAPLRVVQWDGVSTSPYHCLWHIDVPGNIMPLPPGQVVRSLNKSMNALYRKMVAQATRQKTLGLYRTGDEADVEKIQKASDGDLVGVSDPTTVTQVAFGGADQANLAFSMHVRDLFSQMAGNLDSMGGLGPQSETAKQDAMIASAVGKKAARMSRNVVDATVEVIRDFIYRIWEDPINTYEATRQVAGTSVEVNATMGPGDRQGNFGDFSVKIEEYSMQYKSPQERAHEIMGMVTNIIIPMMPILQQQGVGLNTQKLFEVLSKYLSLPELQLILEFIGPPMPGAQGDAAKQPSQTHRTYERISRPGASRQGNSQTMQSLMMGGNPQPAEQAALNRPTGV